MVMVLIYFNLTERGAQPGPAWPFSKHLPAKILNECRFRNSGTGASSPARSRGTVHPPGKEKKSKPQ